MTASSEPTHRAAWHLRMKPKTTKRKVRRMIRQQSAWIMNGEAMMACQIMDLSKTRSQDRPSRIIRRSGPLRTRVYSGRPQAAGLRSGLAPRQDVGHQICQLAGSDIYSAAKKFETGVLYDFADVEGFQQISFIGQDLDFVTRTTGVLFPRP
jgi:hypothetical protein